MNIYITNHKYNKTTILCQKCYRQQKKNDTKCLKTSSPNKTSIENDKNQKSIYSFYIKFLKLIFITIKYFFF